MAFAAAVMSTSAGHKAFTRSPSNDTNLAAVGSSQSISHHPATPPRREPTVRPLPRSSSSNTNNNNNTTMHSPDTNYISQFNTSLSSFKPRSPPGVYPGTTPNSSTTLPESPHMIRCSTCNSLVSLLELSDHICRPSAAPSTSSSTTSPLHHPRQASATQHSRLASGFTHNAPFQHQQPPPRIPQAASRNMLNPLRVNVSQAWQQNGQLEAPLPTPYRTPLPRSPSSASHSPSIHSHTPSPGTSPAGGINLTPSYPFDSHHSEQQHRRYPSSSAAADASDQGAHSPSSRSDTVDYSAENNAGIGARMPFYERLQQERAFGGVTPSSPSPPIISPSLSPAGVHQYSPPLSARSQSKPWGPAKSVHDGGHLPSERQMGDSMNVMPKSPISPGWSGLANEEPELYKPLEETRKSEESTYIEEYQEQEEDHQPLNFRKNKQVANIQNQHHHQHIRETSDSGQSSAALSSSNSYSDHLDYFINDGSTPDTSPEIPNTPSFKDDNDLSGSNSSSSFNGVLSRQQQQQGEMLDNGRRGEEVQEEEEEEYHGYDDDIIDSYPTPQPHFSGRFGGLVIDDEATDAYYNHAHLTPEQEHQEVVDSRQNALAVLPKPAAPSRANSDGRLHDTAPSLKPPLGKGIPSSNSTSDNLPRLAGIDSSVSNPKEGRLLSSRKEDESAIPFTARRRLPLNDLNAQVSPAIIASNSTHNLKTMGSPVTATTPTEASGLRLDACLDDLMKEMNRESIDTIPAASGISGSRSPISLSSSENSTTPTSPEVTSSRRPFDFQSDQQQSHNSRVEVQCGSCNQSVRTDKAVERDGQSFCSECYAQLYLPKCRKCRLPIEDKAIGSGDGKVKGKFHIGCFSCFSCSAPFPTGDFYVFGNRPYCAQHYHERNGTLCANPACSEEQQGIEGPCVSLVGEESGNGGRYHPSCFKCSDGNCDILLDQYHYVLTGLPYCEHHAREIEDQDSSPVHARSASPPRTAVEESDDFYDARYGAASAATPSEQRRRSASLDIPVQSLNALRKNAQAPNYRGMLARRRSSARRRPSESNGSGWSVNGRNQLPMQQPARIAGGGYNGGPPPVSRTRRAEKRRTVISQIRLH